MDKKDVYFKYAKLPKEDGTFSDYFTYYMEHPQQDSKILIRACQEFSYYVVFCMDISVRYKSKKHNKYLQLAIDDDQLDYEDYKIRLFWQNIDIYPNSDLTKINYPNIEGLVKMFLLREGYRGIFKRLLRGETFLNIE